MVDFDRQLIKCMYRSMATHLVNQKEKSIKKT
jgi:hypothetical protein